MSQYEQMKKDFPTMYLRVMRNDAKVRCVAAGPATKEARSTENVLADFAELAEEAGMHEVADELREAATEVLNPEFISSEGQYDELVSLGDAFLDEPRAPRKPRKSRAKKNDPDNFPM